MKRILTGLKPTGDLTLGNYIGAIKQMIKMQDEYDNLDIFYYDNLDLTKLLEDVYSKYNAERVTIQSGGTLNGMFVRNKLIDFVNIVIAPIIVGGKDVATLVDGEAITDEKDLHRLMPMKLLECNKLEDSYIQLKYKAL